MWGCEVTKLDSAERRRVVVTGSGLAWGVGAAHPQPPPYGGRGLILI
jgi:hypothetical protein